MNLNTKFQQLLKSALVAEEQAIACWIGGSTATGFEDEFSDLDIVTISQNPQRIFEIYEQTLSLEFKILETWIVEDSPWKGFHQKFYILNNTPEYYYVDAGVFTNMDSKDYEEQFNSARHGTPYILFDKTRILEAAAKNPRITSPPKINKSNFWARFEIMYRTFLKESLREKYIDSFLFYQRLIQMLVQLQRLEQSPQKFDFGMRYLYRDLTASDAQFIESALKANDIPTLQAQAKLVREKVKTLLKN